MLVYLNSQIENNNYNVNLFDQIEFIRDKSLKFNR